MAEYTLKSFFSRAMVTRLADSIVKVEKSFPKKAFVTDASSKLEELELLDRGRHITRALRRHLPAEYSAAVGILVRSLGPPHATDELEGVGMTPFFYLPHAMFVGLYGLDDFDVSMKAQHEITRRFTCEWSIRPFLEKYPDATLRVLAKFARDPDAHVRRLVSEGTRPRLPWAPRVKWIEAEPERVLPLLETLKDDPASVVRRSVANHLNDVSKSSPKLVHAIAERWLRDASPERRALVSHALRSAVKRGDRKALALLGFGGKPSIAIAGVSFFPKRVAIGGKTRITMTLRSTAKKQQSLAVDLVVHFVKARGTTSAKVFKVARVDLAPRGEATVTKNISLAVHTTRKPNRGSHLVEALINGERFDVGAFEVLSA